MSDTERIAALEEEVEALSAAAEGRDEDLLALSLTWIEGGGDAWRREFKAWYKPGEWLGPHRALSAFLARKFATVTQQRDDLVPLARLGDWRTEGRMCTTEEMLEVGVLQGQGDAIRDTPATIRARAYLAGLEGV